MLDLTKRDEMVDTRAIEAEEEVEDEAAVGAEVEVEDVEEVEVVVGLGIERTSQHKMSDEE